MQALSEHYSHAAPVHRALLSLSEVLVSSAGPAPQGKPSGSQKGRASSLGDWHAQQSLLRGEVSNLRAAGNGAGRAKDAAAQPQRRLSGLTASGKGGKWWQADALQRLLLLRERQQAYEGTGEVHLLLLLATAAISGYACCWSWAGLRSISHLALVLR